jgi:hypothetical protein
MTDIALDHSKDETAHRNGPKKRTWSRRKWDIVMVSLSLPSSSKK